MQRRMTILITLFVMLGLLAPSHRLPAVAESPGPASDIPTSAGAMFIENVG